MDQLDPKADGRSPDLTAENVAELRELFPEVFTDGRIDFEALRQVLGEHIDERPERYGLSWNGKSLARQLAQQPSSGTLRPSPGESVNWETTKNIFIEGDNLEVLKLLQKSYHRKVKMIYIDPPYNTGNEFIYPDRYQDNLDTYLRYTGQVDDAGFKLTSNAETSGRYHTNWLNMMYPRLKLARNLLMDDGVIWISIDDHECADLVQICNEVFGEENFLAQFVWRSRKFTDARSVTNISNDHEYILAYGKTQAASLRGRERDESKYANPDNDSRGPWMSRSILGLATEDQRPNLHYAIVDPATGISHRPPANTGWRYSGDRMRTLISEGAILFPKSAEGRPREKKFRADIQSDFTSFPTIIDDVHTSDGTAELRDYFGAQVFDFPKPHELVRRLIEQVVTSDGIVLDFFAGSGTTAEAAMRFSHTTGVNVQFIMVQLPEKCDAGSEAARAGFATIADIGRERLRRAVGKIGERIEPTQAPQTSSVGGDGAGGSMGFRSFRLAATNIKQWDGSVEGLEPNLLDSIDNIKHDRTDEDVLYELLLKFGLDLALPVGQRTIAGQRVFVIGAGALVVCLGKGIDLNVVEGIGELKAELTPEVMRVVFRDASFKDDVVKTNALQILRRAGINDIKSL